MEKITTSILVEKELHKMAKEQKISMSATLNDALRIKLALPNEKNLVLEEKVALQTKLDYLNSKEVQNILFEKEESQKQIHKQQLGDIKILHAAFAAHCKRDITDNSYNRLLRAFCEKYGLELSQAVALAQNKKVSL